MFNVDDLEFDSILSEAGWDWKYAKSELGDRDTDKEYVKPPSQEPRGESIYGVAKHIWDTLSPEEQNNFKAAYEKKQAAKAKYSDRMQAALNKWRESNKAAQSEPSPKSEPTTDSPVITKTLPPGAPPNAVAIKTSADGSVYIDSDGNDLHGYVAPGPGPRMKKSSPWASDDPKDWPETPKKPVEELKPEPFVAPKSPIKGDRGATIKDTPAGIARIINAELENKPGFIVCRDQNPEIILAGPYPDDIEARKELKNIAAEEFDNALSELSNSGKELTDDQRFRLKQNIDDSLSFRYYDPSREINAEEREKGRRYEYGDMRAKQLSMLEAGQIQSVKDDNEDPKYIESKYPTLDNLKKVWCPLILDKANPPRKPWTLDQVIYAMMPIINRITRQWVGSGFSESDGLAVAIVSVMKALINDRGMSPFPSYARWWIKGDIRRAKKKAGVLPRTLKDKGWGNQGATSTDATLVGADGGETSLSGTIKSDSPGFSKIDCPDCGGTRKSLSLPPESCQYCNGDGKYPDGTQCGLCKGNGFILPPCPTCGGTGRIVITTKDDEMRNRGLSFFKDENGNYQISGDIEGLEKQELLEKLNKAGRLIQKIMDIAKLTPQQQDLINLRFGLKTGTEYGTSDIARMFKTTCEQCGRLNLHKLGSDDKLIDNVCDGCGGKIRGLGTKQGIEISIKKILTKMRRIIVAISNLKTGPKSPKISKELLDLFDWFTEYQKEYGLMDLADTENKEGWVTRPTDPEDEELLVNQERQAEAKAARDAMKKFKTPEQIENARAFVARMKAAKEKNAREQQVRDQYLKQLKSKSDADRDAVTSTWKWDESISMMTAVLNEYVNMMDLICHKTILEEIAAGAFEPQTLSEYI